MTVYDRRFRLDDRTGALGLSFGPDGLSLGGAPLLRRTIAGFVPRSPDELNILMKSAYGGEHNVGRLTSGLGVVAEALNRGDGSRAMIAALQLRLAEVDWRSAARIAAAQAALGKYSPDQPRDRRGRWTDGDDDEPAPGVATGAASATPSRVEVKPPRDSGASGPTRSWGGPVHLEGGRLIPVAMVGNGPPEDPEEIAEPTPFYPAEIPPLGNEPGWRIVGGLAYPNVQPARLPHGAPWPVATITSVRASIKGQPGPTPVLRIYVPRGPYGDILLGSTPGADLPEPPEGYDEVLLRGRPQVTPSRGEETGHADDGVREALRLAATNRFKEICFNLSFTNCTGMVVQSLIRPDVLAVVRPELDLGYKYEPYETLSGRQDLPARQLQMPNVPGIRPVQGRRYKVALAEFMRMRRLAKAFRRCS